MTKEEAMQNYEEAAGRAAALVPDGPCELWELERAFYLLQNYEETLRKNEEKMKKKETAHRHVCPAGRPII